MEKQNDLVDFLISNMKHGRVVFNKNPRNRRRIDCWSFVFVPVPEYDVLLDDAMDYLRELGYIVVDRKTYIEIDDMFVSK